MFNCPKCGKEIPLAQDSCPECGATVEDVRKLFLTKKDTHLEKSRTMRTYMLFVACCGLIAAVALYLY